MNDFEFVILALIGQIILEFACSTFVMTLKVLFTTVSSGTVTSIADRGLVVWKLAVVQGSITSIENSRFNFLLSTLASNFCVKVPNSVKVSMFIKLIVA
jgi:hypothetical protein